MVADLDILSAHRDFYILNFKNSAHLNAPRVFESSRRVSLCCYEFAVVAYSTLAIHMVTLSHAMLTNFLIGKFGLWK